MAQACCATQRPVQLVCWVHPVPLPPVLNAPRELPGCRSGEFWIQCDVCDRWFDGKCVGMTAAKAEQQPQWKCPLCP
jgi:hypothetical protein